MAPLSTLNDNRVFLFGLSLAAGLAVGIARQMLLYYRDTTKVEEPREQTQYITQDTEDALKVSTLSELATNHNYTISKTATKIVLDRSLYDDDVVKGVLRAVTDPDWERRSQGVRALHLLSIEKGGLAELSRYNTQAILVCALSHSRREARYDPADHLQQHFDFRDEAERLCLLLLDRLVSRCGPARAIRAGLVPRWLVHQPWGGRHGGGGGGTSIGDRAGDRERQINFRLVLRGRGASVLSSLFRDVAAHREGMRQLRRHRLVAGDEVYREYIDTRPASSASASGPYWDGSGGGGGGGGGGGYNPPAGAASASAMSASASTSESSPSPAGYGGGGNGSGGNETFETTIGRTLEGGGLRLRDQSEEQERVRRRHREAMVFNNGAQPLGRDDIFQREDEEPLQRAMSPLSSPPRASQWEVDRLDAVFLPRADFPT